MSLNNKVSTYEELKVNNKQRALKDWKLHSSNCFEKIVSSTDVKKLKLIQKIWKVVRI